MFNLYKELIIDHGTNPRNKFLMNNYTNHSKGYNHLCGDKFDIYLLINNQFIKDISFDGSGCVISLASASMMTLILKDKSIDESKKIFDYFKNIITKDYMIDSNFGDLNVFTEVKKFPMRVKCATLAWHTFIDAVGK